MEPKTFSTNYLTAVNWLRGDLILCNEIAEKDENLYLNLYDTMCCECEDDEDFDGVEIYQWYLTNYSTRDCEFLKEHFGLLFVYCDLLDLWVLAVPHWGTAWDYVYCSTDLECAARKLGER